MELIKRFNDSLKINEIAYFNKRYDEAISKVPVNQIVKKKEIYRNQLALKSLNNKYPFVTELTKVLANVNDEALKRKIIVEELINFLSLIKQTNNYRIKDGNCLYELKGYIKVKEYLSDDLPQILTEITIFQLINSNTKEESIVMESDVNNSLSKLKDALSKSKLFDNHKKTFKLKEYEDITSLQSFQYLICFYILEFLGKGINEVNKTELYAYFNTSFKITRHNKPQLMTTKNWDNFKSDKLDSLPECQFYNDLCKDLKNITGLPTKPSMPS